MTGVQVFEGDGVDRSTPPMRMSAQYVFGLAVVDLSVVRSDLPPETEAITDGLVVRSRLEALGANSFEADRLVKHVERIARERFPDNSEKDDAETFATALYSITLSCWKLPPGNVGAGN
jgi:hypothetical protein